MAKIDIYRSFPGLTSEDYQDHVQTWLEITDRDEARAFYEQELFPRSCYRIRLLAPEASASLFFVPVGTQGFAPTLACLGTPAKETVLLHTKESKVFAQQVVALFEEDRSFHQIQIDGDDPRDIVLKMQSACNVLGQPREVVCDLTGGTKVMTATVAGMAAVNGWRQVYVKSTFLQQKGSHSEEILEVPSFFEALGGWDRVIAESFAERGHFAEASEHLKKASELSIATAEDQKVLKSFELAQAYRQARLSVVIKKAKTFAKAQGASISHDTLEVLENGPTEGLSFWIAHCLAQEGQKLAAWGILQHLGSRCNLEEVNRELKRLKKLRDHDWALAAWQPMDDLFGSGFTSRLRARG